MLAKYVISNRDKYLRVCVSFASQHARPNNKVKQRFHLTQKYSANHSVYEIY